MIKLTLQKTDTLGSLASTLCVIHCLATPLLFISPTCPIGDCAKAPDWWRNLDYFLLIISFLAVMRSAKNTTISFMKPALWLSWMTLFLLIINEKIQLMALPETMTYVAASSLIILHMYNMKYCQCKTHKCCIQNG